ncbi:hypothetical protein [Neorhizobium petrolearium]
MRNPDFSINGMASSFSEARRITVVWMLSVTKIKAGAQSEERMIAK